MISKLSIFYSIRLKILSNLASFIVLTNVLGSAAISADLPTKVNTEAQDFFDARMYIGLILSKANDPLPSALYQNYNELIGWKFVGGGDFHDNKHSPITDKLFYMSFVNSNQNSMVVLVEETGRLNKYKNPEVIIRDAIGFRADFDTSLRYPDDLKLCPKVSKSGEQVFFIGNERPLKNKKGGIEGYELKPVRYAWSLDRAAMRFVRASVDGIHCRAYLDI